MKNGEQNGVEGVSESTSDMSAGTPNTLMESPRKDKTVAISELIDGMIESLNQLGKASFSREDLKKVGIASSFQDLPCTIDICLTKEIGTNEETTRIRRELKHILQSKCSAKGTGADGHNEESYLTYVDVGIEHCVKPAKRGPGWKLAGVVAWIVIVALVGMVLSANWFSPPRQKTEVSNSVVRQFDGTNLMQKAEMSVWHDSREK